MKKRSQARQVAMKTLFAMTLVSADLEGTLEYLRHEDAVPPDALEFSRELARGAHRHRDEIDAKIRANLRRFDYSRVGNVEKAILRIAVFELLHCPETPAKVAINEAVELGKEFTTHQSVRFINAILDRIAEELRPGTRSAGKKTTDASS